MSVNIKISNPLIKDLELTYLSRNVKVSDELNVISSQFFSTTNELILVGNEKYDNAEIKKIVGITGNVIKLDSNVQNEHVTGEQVRKLQFDKVQVYKKSFGEQSFTLLDTVTVTYNNPLGETVYTDNFGTSGDLYKVKYYNSITHIASDFSSEINGVTVPSGSSYLDLNEFRNMTGINDTEIPDGVLSEFLTRATYDVKKKCFAREEEKLINPDTIGREKRYFFEFSPTKSNNRLGYLADWNLDGQVDVQDIVVIEKNSNGGIRNDITNKVDTLDNRLGYFTLRSDYELNPSYKVFVSYSWMNYPLDDEYVKYDMKRLIMHICMMYVIEWYRNQIRRGITKQSLGGLTIERNMLAWDKLEEYHNNKAREFVNRFKPLLWSKARDQSTWHGVGSYYGYGSYYNTGNYSPYYSKF